MPNILPGQAGYDVLLSQVKRNGGKTAQLQGQTYRAVLDGDHYKFVPVGEPSFASTYASNIRQPGLDVPMKSDTAEPSETRAQKPKARRSGRTSRSSG